MRITCDLCPHACKLSDGKIGICHARKNEQGKIISINYGQITALALDPIEKKPLNHFYPGSRILSAGSFGCNLRCPFCQNSDISMSDESISRARYMAPKQLIEQAVEMKMRGNIGIAYTYNEPLIGYEYVMDCSKLAHKQGLKNVVVTNGYINKAPLQALLPHIDAMNIDLKGYTNKFYNIAGGKLDTVKNTIEMSAEQCHIEITTLIIPGLNDGKDEMREQCKWLASIRPTIPLHISRFFPRYKMQDRPPTPVDTIDQLADVAREYLDNVYLGNC